MKGGFLFLYMKRIKLLIVFIFIFFFCYTITYVIYTKFVINNNYIDAYVLNKNIMRGNSISSDDVIKIKVLKDSYNEDITMLKNRFDENILINENLSKGQIISNNMFVTKEEYNYRNGKELVSIELDKDDTVINSRLRKNILINIYFTQEVDNKIETNIALENATVVDVYDDNANSIECGNNASKITIYVPKNKVMEINNFKEKGKIKISIIN